MTCELCLLWKTSACGTPSDAAAEFGSPVRQQIMEFPTLVVYDKTSGLVSDFNLVTARRL
jgi:hypothetical protein